MVFHCLLDNNYHELTSEIKLNFSNGGAICYATTTSINLSKGERSYNYKTFDKLKFIECSSMDVIQIIESL